MFNLQKFFLNTIEASSYMQTIIMLLQNQHIFVYKFSSNLF